jgi:hypothetical protein
MKFKRVNHEWREVADEIWAMIREDREDLEKLKKTQEEINRILEETAQERKKTERMMKETDKRMGNFGNRFGEVVEYMVVPGLVKKFQELGIRFDRSNHGAEVKDEKNDIFLEVDSLMENEDKVMAVEITSKPRADDVQDHIERMEKLRKYADLKGDSRVYLGAIAGVVFTDTIKKYALKKGFYVIEPSGESFAVTEPSGEYCLREW